MKNLKMKSVLFSLLAMMAVAVFMTSCGQESIIEEDLEGWETSPLGDETSLFIPASESEDPNLDVDAIINQLNNESANSSVDGRCPCGVNLINDVTPPNWNGNPDWINLNIKYDIIPNAQVRVFHYLRSANGWTYQGYDTIYHGGYSGDDCPSKSVNMSTGQIPYGYICSIARVWTGSSYCSPWDYVFWNH